MEKIEIALSAILMLAPDVNTDEERKMAREKVKKDFEFGRARLFRPEVAKRVDAEIKEDRERLYAHFKQQEPKKQLELMQCLYRLLLSISKLASYHGILKGHQISSRGMELAEDRAKLYLVTDYLDKHPGASFQDMCEYLDRKNSRLIALRTSKKSPLWAPIPPSWRKAIERLGIDPPPSEYELWRTALEQFPGRVEPYLSRARKLATDVRSTNILRVWPRIIREHRKLRKTRKGGTAANPAAIESTAALGPSAHSAGG